MLWAGNAVVGRMLVGSMPPVAMNVLRWLLVAFLLAPLGWRVLRHPQAIAQRWRHLALIGALGVGTYNALQYLALQTSSPINVTLIGASIPVWMMVVGRLCFGQPLQTRQLIGAVLSVAGVLLVMSQGQWATLAKLRLVPGDLLMLLASLAWAFYSWLLARPPASMQGAARPDWDWAGFLWIQVGFGLTWAGMCAGGEAALTPAWSQTWTFDARTAIGLLFIAIGPSILAYWGWGQGVRAVGPTVAAFFSNLTPVFAAVWAWALLGTSPQWYHPCALLLIGAGIALSAGRPPKATGSKTTA